MRRKIDNIIEIVCFCTVIDQTYISHGERREGELFTLFASFSMGKGGREFVYFIGKSFYKSLAILPSRLLDLIKLI